MANKSDGGGSDGSTSVSSSSSDSTSSSSSSSSSSDYDVFRDALQHFAAEQNTLNTALQHSQHTLDLHFATFDSQLKRCAQQWAEYTRLQDMQHDLYAGMSKEEKRRLKAQMVDDDIVLEMTKQQLDQWRQCKPNNQTRSVSQSVTASAMADPQHEERSDRSLASTD